MDFFLDKSNWFATSSDFQVCTLSEEGKTLNLCSIEINSSLFAVKRNMLASISHTNLEAISIFGENKKKKQTLHFFTLRFSISRKTPKLVPPSWKEKKQRKKIKKSPRECFQLPLSSFVSDPFFPLERKGKLHSANPHIFWPIFHQLQKDPRKRQVCTFSFPHKTRTVGKRGNSC